MAIFFSTQDWRSRLLKPKLLFVVTEDWYFVSHRLPHAIAALEAGFDVVVATRISTHENTIREAGIRVIRLELSRRGGRPLKEIYQLISLFRIECPDLLHLVALKPVVYGGLAAWLAGLSRGVYAIAGLGGFASSRGLRAIVSRLILKLLLKFLMLRKGWRTIVQNPDDRDFLVRGGVSCDRIRLIRGAGVDVSRFHPLGTATQNESPTIIFAARMLWNKGAGEFVAAARQLQAIGVKSRFVLVGAPDLHNPGSVPEHTIREWVADGVVEWWGHRADMADIYQHAHIACLPSAYGEGVPKTLLEAAACGLPIVTTNAPGCREVVTDGFNGYLVPPKDVNALAGALLQLIHDPVLRAKQGKASRRLAEAEFRIENICRQTLEIYRELMT